MAREEKEPSILEDVNEDILRSLLRKDYVVGALRSSTVSSKPGWQRQYPEMAEVPEIKRLTNDSEKQFVWWFACRCSPIIDLPEERRVEIACEKAFKAKGVQEARKLEYRSMSFGPEMKDAIKAMDRFDPGGRITAMAYDLHLLEQCQNIIGKDMRGVSMETTTEWLKAVKVAREMRDDVLRRIESGSLGVEERKNTNANLEDIMADHMRQQLS